MFIESWFTWPSTESITMRAYKVSIRNYRLYKYDIVSAYFTLTISDSVMPLYSRDFNGKVLVHTD
mgnify:CR=1 FL=1